MTWFLDNFGVIKSPRPEPWTRTVFWRRVNCDAGATNRRWKGNLPTFFGHYTDGWRSLSDKRSKILGSLEKDSWFSDRTSPYPTYRRAQECSIFRTFFGHFCPMDATLQEIQRVIARKHFLSTRVLVTDTTTLTTAAITTTGCSCY